MAGFERYVDRADPDLRRCVFRHPPFPPSLEPQSNQPLPTASSSAGPRQIPHPARPPPPVPRSDPPSPGDSDLDPNFVEGEPSITVPSSPVSQSSFHTGGTNQTLLWGFGPGPKPELQISPPGGSESGERSWILTRAASASGANLSAASGSGIPQISKSDSIQSLCASISDTPAAESEDDTIAVRKTRAKLTTPEASPSSLVPSGLFERRAALQGRNLSPLAIGAPTGIVAERAAFFEKVDRSAAFESASGTPRPSPLNTSSAPRSGASTPKANRNFAIRNRSVTVGPVTASSSDSGSVHQRRFASADIPIPKTPLPPVPALPKIFSPQGYLSPYPSKGSRRLANTEEEKQPKDSLPKSQSHRSGKDSKVIRKESSVLSPKSKTAAVTTPSSSSAKTLGKTLPEIVFEGLRGTVSDNGDDAGADVSSLQQNPRTPQVHRPTLRALVGADDNRPKPKMAWLHPSSAVAMTAHRREAMQLAKQQEETVKAKCARNNVEFPPYSFEEMIGKGSFGRVYRCRHNDTKKVVAIKVIDIDDADFSHVGPEAEEQIKDFNKEVRILKDLKESGVPNLNSIIEARSVHSQLWMVCEHVQGGSVKTLMRATDDKLSEKFIIPVAREVAKALAGLHKAGFMHRDVKAANILVHEMGAIQLCDFGIATPIAHHNDKRKTFIGTLHYMAPEIFVDDSDREYDYSVDTWAFGCSIYEMAVGKPPNTDLRELRQLQSRMRRLNKGIELPTDEEYPESLRKLVSDLLIPNKEERLTMEDVLNHEYLVDTELTYPTVSLRELVQEYYTWLIGGGNRVSLFVAFGARGAQDQPDVVESEDWNFDVSTTFSQRMSTMLNIPDFSQLDDYVGNSSLEDIEEIPQGSTIDKKNFERRVERGAKELQNIFDQSKPDYEYKAKRDFVPFAPERRISDLPLRAVEDDRPYSIASNVIDLGDFDSDGYRAVDTAVKLADPATIRANRSNSKLFKESVIDQNPPPMPGQSSNDYYESGYNNTATRTDIRDFSFPPKEWIQQAEPSNDEANAAEPSEDKKAKKHKTMEWSFASAMAEVQSDDEAPSASQNKPAAPPPLMRTTTVPVTARDRQDLDDRPGTAMSETEVDPFHFDQEPASRFQEDAMGMAIPEGLSTDDFYSGPGPSTDADDGVEASPAPTIGRVSAPTGPLEPPSLMRGPSALQRLEREGYGRRAGGSVATSGGWGVVEFPDVAPPSANVLTAGATPEELEAELSGLLRGLVDGLAAAEVALDMASDGRRGRAVGGSSGEE